MWSPRSVCAVVAKLLLTHRLCSMKQKSRLVEEGESLKANCMPCKLVCFPPQTTHAVLSLN